MRPMTVFKTKTCARRARKLGIADSDLCAAIERAERGAIDADLGGGAIKQRIPRPSSGRSRGFRAIFLFCSDGKAFFVHAYPKSGVDNIDENQLKIYRKAADTMCRLDEEGIAEAMEKGAIVEVRCN